MTHARIPGASRTLLTGFRASAERAPDSVALVLPDASSAKPQYSYGELSEEADRWAAVLISGLGRPPERVGVLAGRNDVRYLGILAALASGAAYVPLNPHFPSSRLAQMIAAARLDAIIVDPQSQSLAEELSGSIPYRPFWLAPRSDALPDARSTGCTREGVEETDAVATLPAPSPGSLAYLLFTSGSTGQPKGVPIRHENALHFLDVNQERYELTPDDRVSQASEFTFDLSVFDVFMAWNAGAALYPLGPLDLLTPNRFISRHEITVWFSVPSVISLLRKKSLPREGELPSLRWSLFCGEALPMEAAEAWQAAAPNSVVENLYGPTEVTVACLVHRWDPEVSPALCENGTVPIGVAYPGLSPLIVDDELRPVEASEEVSGELCVGGPQTFDGYWQDAEKTAAALFERATPDGPQRYYRTGDRVRPLPNGELIYLGRLDQQVKVLGYRVELGDVESALREFEPVVDAAVVPWPSDGFTAEALVAFVTGNAEPDDVLTFAAERLPTHMRPRQVRTVTTMPLNANGKIDRRALRATLESEESA